MDTESPDQPRRSVTALRRVLILGVLLGFAIGLGGVFSSIVPMVPAAQSATIALGFLLITAFLAGLLAGGLGLPRITGYIVLGLIVGPGVLDIVTDANVASLRLIDDIAISLIALAAGAELRLSELRERGRAMLGIMSIEMIAVFVVVAGAVVLLSGLLPFTAGRPTSTVLVIALIFGSIAIANSPSVAIAVINDTNSRGPVSSTILGVTVMKDVVIILFFAVALSVAKTVLTVGAGFEMAFFLDLAWEIGGSVLVGALGGWLASLYLRGLRKHVVLFALAAAFLNAEIAALLHLEVLILSLTAGFFLQNISAETHADEFVEALEANSLPVYALFFSLAGASIHLNELTTLWPFALAFVVARGLAVFSGTWLGATISNTEPEVRRYAWLGFISQAGVTLGMVVIAERSFPEWGGELQTLFVAMVAIHELIGPVLLQHGLKRAGEVGARVRATPKAPVESSAAVAGPGAPYGADATG